MDRIGDLDTAGLEQFSELATLALRLRRGQPTTSASAYSLAPSTIVAPAIS